MFETLFAKLAGKWIGSKLNLQEDSQMDTPWYKNKSTLSHIVTGIIGISGIVVGVMTNDFHVAINPSLAKYGGYFLTLLSGVGIYENHA